MRVRTMRPTQGSNLRVRTHTQTADRLLHQRGSGSAAPAGGLFGGLRQCAV
jgi:hypothetical protein